MDNRTFAKDLYKFLKDNDSLGHFGDIPAEDGISELEEYLSDLDMVKETIKDIEEIADSFDDHDVYVTEVKPLLKGLRTVQEKLEAEQSKRMVADTGYEVKQSIQIGNQEILMAENLKAEDGNFYMKAEYTENGLIGEYSQVAVDSDYLEIMREFTKSLHGQIEKVASEIGKAAYQSEPITAKECHPNDYSQSIVGKVVAIKAEALRPEYRRGDRQLILVDGGNGANANARGNAVFCTHLNDGSRTRFERYDVQGEMKELPAWAAARLDAINAEREAARHPIPKSAPQETVAGYTITERVNVGKKTFVLGHNPKAVSPFVTWQQLEGRSGYDLGHYFSDRDRALADLHTRADSEREATSPVKARNPKNRDDAR
ncbi:hypothetical protein [Caproiciproducens sp. CPB-2]|uniref:hypothetical protein n=1 Tax=Caproiciproducens sp. CPB-2 TaxID=3030017 RepID=UPI0023DA8255|nr:hypothetical protein [Caproiciproducens sp. CPB-2]MDF1494574.1 hypothetical protein [Caproiciproducens sp. CPB-2]